jgi:hypothetical protein
VLAVVAFLKVMLRARGIKPTVEAATKVVDGLMLSLSARPGQVSGPVEV